MPEGDTLWRAAARLHSALATRTVVAFTATNPELAALARRHGLVGSRVEAAEARGKHLLVRFSCGAALHTHMGMTGSWHLYRKGSRWRKAPHLARVVVDTGEVIAVCFLPRTAEILGPAAEAGHGALARLGPDVLSPTFAAAAAAAALRACGEQPIGVALLDQTVLSGIGNIYKSETLFLCGADPFDPVSAFDDPALLLVVRTASRLMRRNLDTPSRRTTPDQSALRYHVYRREGRPCRRCGSAVHMARQGEQRRSSYWCPRCQPARRRLDARVR